MGGFVESVKNGGVGTKMVDEILYKKVADKKVVGENLLDESVFERVDRMLRCLGGVVNKN
jgi:hypothetical protein